MSWNNITPAWAILPCSVCKKYHPPGLCGCRWCREGFYRNKYGGHQYTDSECGDVIAMCTDWTKECQDEVVSSGTDVRNPEV